jgi:hypothetical protein
MTCPLHGDNSWKRLLIPNEVSKFKYLLIKVGDTEKCLAVAEWFMGYQLVGRVKAYQGNDV